VTFESAAIARVSQGTSPRVRTAAWILWAFALIVPACVLLGGASGDDVSIAVLFGAATMVVGMALLMADRGRPVAGVLRAGPAGTVTIDDAAVHLPSQRVNGADVIDGWREEHGSIQQVVMQLASGDILTIRVPDTRTGDALLDAVSVGMRKRAVTLRIGGVDGALRRAVLAIFSAVGALFAVPITIGMLGLLFAGVFTGALVTGAMALPAWVVFIVAARMLGIRTIRIGRDGVTSKLDLTPARFVPYRGMHVARERRAIELSSGLMRARFRTSSVREAIAIAARIEEARAAYHERAALRADLLARQGKPLDQWREQLRLLVAHDGYRSGLGPAELVAIVEDPSIAPDERVAAATALSTLPDRDRKRLRAAVDTTVDPKLRIALEQALEGVIDEDALDAARARH
jgi:hypothetical protein